MKHKSLVNALAKEGMNASLKKEHIHKKVYQAETPFTITTWYTEDYDNHQGAYNIYVIRKHLRDILEEDYLAGDFFDKIKSVIQHANWKPSN